MKNALLFLCLLASSLSLFAIKEAPAKGSFAHHCGEFHITPSTDYFFYPPGDISTAPMRYDYKLPFLGFDLGGQYMYRPVELFGISAGLGFRMQGNYYRHTTYSLLGEKYVNLRSIGHTGFIQVPIEFHLFKQMEHSTFEFATGPQFNFPVFNMYNSNLYNSNGDKISSSKGKTNYSSKQMGDDAMLGWNILLGAELNLCDHADLFIGPQINFLNIASFKKDENKATMDYGRPYDCSLGIKLGFRFHCEQ